MELIQIPGIAAVGPIFNDAVAGSITLTEAIDFTYGFDLTVSDPQFAMRTECTKQDDLTGA